MTTILNAEIKAGYCYCKDRFYMDEKDDSYKDKVKTACSKIIRLVDRCKAPNSVSDDGICKLLEDFKF